MRTSLLASGSFALRAGVSLFVALLALALLADAADAQRRRRRRTREPVEAADAQRRRRRRTREPVEAAEPVETAETPDPTPAEPAAAPDAGTAAVGPDPAATTPPAAATPPPSVAPVVSDPGPLPPDLGPLRSDWSTLMDDMVSARQRVATLGEELFRTRLAVTIQDRAGDDQVMTRLALELDGTPIFHTDTEITGDEGREVFQAALAPGPHVLTLELEQSARDGTEYRYSQRDSFRFIVVRDRRTEITIVLEDDSDIARSFGSAGEGRYEIRTRVRVATRALE